MTGPGIDYDFFTIQNHHIPNEVNEIKTKISYGIGSEISFNKKKFDNFRMDLNQEVTRRALILETFQKNILTRNSAEELPGIGYSGYLSQLLDITKALLLKDGKIFYSMILYTNSTILELNN
jgi:hypothetical protein